MCLNIMLKKRMNLNTHLYISPSLYSAALFPLFLYVILFYITPTLMYDSPQTITPIFPLVTLPYFASVISFTTVPTCFSPPSVLSRVFPLTPPLFCMLFLSPLLPPASPLPLCYTLSPPIPFLFLCLLFLLPTLSLYHTSPCATPLSSLLHPHIIFVSVIPSTSTPTCISSPHVPHPCLPSYPLPYFVSVISFTTTPT